MAKAWIQLFTRKLMHLLLLLQAVPKPEGSSLVSTTGKPKQLVEPFWALTTTCRPLVSPWHLGEQDYWRQGSKTPFIALYGFHPNEWGTCLWWIPGAAQVGDDGSTLYHSQRAENVTMKPGSSETYFSTIAKDLNKDWDIGCNPKNTFLRSPFVRVVLGAHSIMTRETSQQIFGIQESIAHPHYNAQTVKNDIRLLKLNGSATFSRFVKRILLPRPDADLRPGRRCLVTGWGDISNFGTVPTKLMEVGTTIISRKACNITWVGKVFNCMICAVSSKNYLRGFCSGDSGGPLVCGRRVHGIVSFNGQKCGNPRIPDVYTRISNYISWTRSILQMF